MDKFHNSSPCSPFADGFPIKIGQPKKTGPFSQASDPPGDLRVLFRGLRDRGGWWLVRWKQLEMEIFLPAKTRNLSTNM